MRIGGKQEGTQGLSESSDEHPCSEGWSAFRQYKGRRAVGNVKVNDSPRPPLRVAAVGGGPVFLTAG